MPQTVSHLGNSGGSWLYLAGDDFFRCILSWICRQCRDPKLDKVLEQWNAILFNFFLLGPGALRNRVNELVPHAALLSLL